MPLELKLGLKLSQKLIMTPSLQQAIKLLQMSKLELVEEVNQELTENPVLEEAGPTEENGAEAEEKPAEEAEAETETDTPEDDFDYEAFFQDQLDASYIPRQSDREVKEPTSFEANLTRPENLGEYLLWQLQMDAPTGPVREVCRCIIGNIDARGYLQASLDEIRELAGCPAEQALEAVRLVQTFDPPGVAAMNLEECLALQLHRLDLAGSPAETLVREHLDKLQEHRYREIAEKMQLTRDEVQHYVGIIRQLDPRPGFRFGGDNSHYVTPDVYIVKMDGGYTVVLNEDGLPRLRISPVYRRLLEAGPARGNREEREYVREKYRAAFRLIKSLEERQRTIFKVATSIVKHQRGFLDHGTERLRPLVLKDVARDIEMHESTVSRVVNNKFMHTHRGLFEMRFFFHSGIQSSDGEDVSSFAVKQRIRQLVEQEDPRHPLSDSSIVKLLEQKSLHIARRTVAKYREELRIPSSTLRKRAQAR